MSDTVETPVYAEGDLNAVTAMSEIGGHEVTSVQALGIVPGCAVNHAQ